MKLIECYIESFGTFREHRVRFDRGLNCFRSDNGSGKTTLTVFIASMLFGFPDTKKQSLDENDRKKYNPWQGGRYGGSLTLEVGGREYVIERTFGSRPADDEFTLRDARRGALSSDYSERIGEEIFGIDRDGFLRTVYLSEKNLSIKNENKSISAKLGDLVGVDGDLGGFDAAIALLDERRKYYYKKSGNCEIGNVRARIAELTLEHDRLAAAAASAARSEDELGQMLAARASLEKRREKLTAEMLAGAKAREQIASEERYRAMAAQVSADGKRLAEIEELLGGRIPTAKEIDEARFAMLEGERILAEECAPRNEELDSLAKKYSRLDAAMLAEAERRVGEEERELYAYRRLEERMDAGTDRIRRLFPRKVPTRDEISTLAGGKAVMSAVLITLGILLSFSGLPLGALLSAVLYSLSAIGAILLAVGVTVLAGKRARRRRAIARIEEQTGRSFDGKDAYARLLSDLEEAEHLTALREREMEEKRERLNALGEWLDDFLRCFGAEEATDHASGVAMVRRGYTEYYSLTVIRRNATQDRQARLATAESMVKRAREFLSRYQIDSADPFAELSRLASEHEHRLLSYRRGQLECEEYARAHGVTGNVTEEVREDRSTELKDELTDIENKWGELARRITLLEQSRANDMRSLDRLEEVSSELDGLKETLARHERSLGIIQSTIAMLREASDNMTSRYIGKTRERFAHYENAIGGSGGDFALDTDFTLTKSERGAARGVESFSRGTRDLYALSLRLALIDSLYGDEQPFIMLDDPFISMDDTRLERGKELLRTIAGEKQILYFTCSQAREI